MPAYKKVNPILDQNFRIEWSRSHEYCAGCGIGRTQAQRYRWPGLSSHHIVKFRRSDEACVLLRLCQREHDLAEGLAIRVNGILIPRLTIGICASIKKLADPDEFNLERLIELYGRPIELEPIPEFLLAERKSRR